VLVNQDAGLSLLFENTMFPWITNAMPTKAVVVLPHYVRIARYRDHRDRVIAPNVSGTDPLRLTLKEVLSS
jgi:hypothetical protein